MESGREDQLDKMLSRVSQWRAGLPVGPMIAALISIAIVAWMVWGGSVGFIALWAGANDWGEPGVPDRTAVAGAWGDSFGGFNALVGAIGSAAIITTLYLQYRGFEHQRREQEVARFEENFFRLIDLMRSLREELVYQHTSSYLKIIGDDAVTGRLKGHEAIEAAYNEVKHWAFKGHHKHKTIKKSIISGQYNNYVHKRYEYCFAPYFRIIYTILYRVHNERSLNSGQKQYYANILRSQLTSYEIGLLAFNATSKFAKDLSFFIVEFRLLKYLPQNRRKVIQGVFDERAYQART